MSYCSDISYSSFRFKPSFKPSELCKTYTTNEFGCWERRFDVSKILLVFFLFCCNFPFGYCPQVFLTLGSKGQRRKWLVHLVRCGKKRRKGIWGYKPGAVWVWPLTWSHAFPHPWPQLTSLCSWFGADGGAQQHLPSWSEDTLILNKIRI